jgi:hypothetical protein
MYLIVFKYQLKKNNAGMCVDTFENLFLLTNKLVRV